MAKKKASGKTKSVPKEKSRSKVRATSKKTRKTMKSTQPKSTEVDDYRHDAKRRNNPSAGMASYERVQEEPKAVYNYSPHLSPQLVWAGKPGLNQVEVEEAVGCQVDTISLHVHERISTKAIVDAVQRKPKQMSLFADPELPLHEAIKFYQHDVDWANRLVLGDNLLIMNSLIQRELTAGKVQTIYFDPPYGVDYKSNFQPRIDQRDVKDTDRNLTREPEQIKAYRDTWTLGVHSYLTYLRDRLILCREMLSETGSIFVQISDANLHHVREIMDEIFSPENFVSIITFQTTSGFETRTLSTLGDFLIWYAKDKEQVKVRKLFERQPTVPGEGNARWVLFPDGDYRGVRAAEKRGEKEIPEGAKFYKPSDLQSQGSASEPQSFVHMGRTYKPGSNNHWKASFPEGMQRLARANRIHVAENSIQYRRFAEDFPYGQRGNIWTDTITGSFTERKMYAVQTNVKVVERCILLTTDPSDLVFDPSCGSGTTALAAEKWGRRWITCDTSRVALTLARQRLMTATYPYFQLADPKFGIEGGFKYAKIPHITLESIAHNARIDGVEDQEKIDQIIREDAPQEILYDQPNEERNTVRISGPFTVEAIPPPIVQDEISIGHAPEPNLEGIPTPLREEGAGHIHTLIDLLQKDGVTFPGNRKMLFATLTPRVGGVLHAEGAPKQPEGQIQRVAISFGPLHGPVTMSQVEAGLRDANRGGYDAIIFCGFAFEGPAQTAIESDIHPQVRAFLAHIRPDIIMQDADGDNLLKATASSQLFTVFGEPDVELREVKESKEEIQVEVHGVDVYDPTTGEVYSAHVDQVAAWFLDTDYDGRTFCICQAFFPNKSAWSSLEKALKGNLDQGKFEALTGRISLPFTKGEHSRIAVKVIDQRGNEVMKTSDLERIS
jgi:adenine-specific DNA-methyltransferase